MKWKKLDFCYTSTGKVDGFYGAAVPQAIPWKENIYRIYYSPRNESNQSHIFFLDIDMDTLDIVYIHPKPVLSPGKLGCFDDSGTMMSWIGRIEDQLWLYYCGWNLGKTVPFRNSIGLAVSDDGERFTRKYDGPVVDRTYQEPQFCGSSWLLKEAELFRMWYLSCVEWRMRNDEIQHRYHLKYAESKNGIDWKRDGIVAIDFMDDSEYAISRPTVIKTENGYHMWFSHRGNKYRIGYATSIDGITWQRKDEEVGITVSKDGFDNDMICYPAVFRYKDDYYMLFNGNEYGMTGFGIAKLVEGIL